MPFQENIKTAMERVTKTLQAKPAFGLGTGISKATIKQGLTCEIKEGNWTFIADMPQQVGGNAAGPTPGVFGRAALGSCLAIGYMMQAVKQGIVIHSLEVEVQADYDDGALYGTSPGVPPGYLEVRYSVTVNSEALEEEVLLVIEEADKLSPYLDVFRRVQKCMRSVHVISTKKS